MPCFRYVKQVDKPLPFSYPSSPVTIGEHIRKKRMELKLLQSDVAECFDVSTDCITYWENNRSNPQIKFFPKIIDFLGYNPLDFDESTLSGKIKAYWYRTRTTSSMFANLFKVDQSTVTEWESGKCLPASKHLIELEALLDNSVSQILSALPREFS